MKHQSLNIKQIILIAIKHEALPSDSMIRYVDSNYSRMRKVDIGRYFFLSSAKIFFGFEVSPITNYPAAYVVALRIQIQTGPKMCRHLVRPAG